MQTLDLSWPESIKLMAQGNLGLNSVVLEVIGKQIDVLNLREDLLPSKATVLGSVNDRKNAILAIANGIWGIAPQDFLDQEREWNVSARSTISSQESTGKDDFNDIISAEILVRLVGASHFLLKYPKFATEAALSVELMVYEACLKGRTRMTRVGGEGSQTVYGAMRDHGVMIGSGGGKFLPNPEVSLPQLFALLDKEKILPSAYK
jgi:hypothetical protein